MNSDACAALYCPGAHGTSARVTAPRIVIFSDNSGWHESRLADAFTRRSVHGTVVALGDCGIGTGAMPLHIPGFDDSLPDAAFVRAIPDGSFEEVTLRLDVLHALEACGVTVYNPPRAIERTVDKAMTSFLLLRDGIPTPGTWVCASRDEAARVAARECTAGAKLVLKPLFGNCGRGLMLIEHADMLPPAEYVDGVWYLQSFIGQPGQAGRDWRVFVIGGRAAAAMERISGNWITNRARGGQCLPALLTDELRNTAERAAAVTGAGYAGVDIIRDTAGNYLVLEVNGVPAWRGLQSVHPADIAELLADDLLGRLAPGERLSADTACRDFR
jgi:tetrahydromethanopterin:alpha-L-glutamate ligase